MLRYVERFPDRELARFAIDRHWHRYVSDDDQLAARQAVAEYEHREFPWLCEIETD